jgi:hypothetical protein
VCPGATVLRAHVIGRKEAGNWLRDRLLEELTYFVIFFERIQLDNFQIDGILYLSCCSDRLLPVVLSVQLQPNGVVEWIGGQMEKRLIVAQF